MCNLGTRIYTVTNSREKLIKKFSFNLYFVLFVMINLKIQIVMLYINTTVYHNTTISLVQISEEKKNRKRKKNTQTHLKITLKGKKNKICINALDFCDLVLPIIFFIIFIFLICFYFWRIFFRILKN